MALKGTTKIELTNVKTGQKEVIEKTNLVTNAVNDILTLNPYGARFRDYFTYFRPNNETSTAVTNKQFAAQFLPMCPNLFGGILLYENALEEDATKYFADMDNPLVGYSSNVVNQGEDTKRGSMNQTESGPLDDGTGYRFVFDFATSQANGTISALGLTSKMGGVAGYGSLEDNYSNFVFEIDRLGSDYIGGAFSAEGMARKNVVSLDVENGEAIYAYVSGLNTITLGKLKFPTYSLGLRDSYDSYLEDVLYSETIVVTQTFATVLDSNNGIFYGTLIDGGDGYIWGFQHEGNAKGNSADSATVLWVKISKEDWSFEEGTWTIDAQLEYFGDYHTGYNDKTYSYDRNNLIIKDGILYAIKYATTANAMSGVYLIPLENPTNITLLEFEDGGTVFYNSAEYASDYRHYNTTNVNEINGVIRYRGAYINGGVLHKANYMQNDTYGNMCLRMCAKPGLKFGPFIFGIGSRSYTTASPYGVISTYIQSCYLATINNLATPVEKTADKTMKITYILREE